MTRSLESAVILAAVLCVLVIGAALASPFIVHPDRQVPAVFIAEDSPGWNCRTMGNQHC